MCERAVGTMVEPITFLRAGAKFACGDNIYTNLMVVNFTGPGGIEASAYCCNVNIDIDGEPQAYGPADNPRIKPKERLRNGGFRSPEQNQAMKDTYEAAKKTVQDLEQKKADIIAKSKPSDDPAKPAVAARSGGHGEARQGDRKSNERDEEGGHLLVRQGEAQILR